MVQLSHPYMTTGKITGLTLWIIVGKVMSLLSNILSRFVITFLPRSKDTSWVTAKGRKAKGEKNEALQGACLLLRAVNKPIRWKADWFLVAMGWVPAQTIGHTMDPVSVSLFYNKLFPIEQILSMPAWYDFRQDFSNEGEKCHMKILYSTCYKLKMQNRFILFSMTTPDALQLQSLEYQANNGEKVKPCQGVSRERGQEGRFTFFLYNNFLKMWKTSVNVPWNLCERSKLSERFFSSYHYLHLFLSSI